MPAKACKRLLLGIFFKKKRRNETDEIISIFVNVFSVKSGVHGALCMTKHEIVSKKECVLYVHANMPLDLNVRSKTYMYIYANSLYFCKFLK